MCLAVPGRVVSVEALDGLVRTARVDFSGVIRVVNLTFVPEAEVGDYVLVHVGFALSRIDEEAAERIFTDLEMIARLETSSGGGS